MQSAIHVGVSCSTHALCNRALAQTPCKHPASCTDLRAWLALQVEQEALRPPMFEGNWGNKPERCLVEDAFKALVVEPVVRACAASMLCGFCPSKLCYRVDPALHAEPIAARLRLRLSAQGFNWVNEGKRPDSPKWGYVSTSVGNNLKLKVWLSWC